MLHVIEYKSLMVIQHDTFEKGVVFRCNYVSYLVCFLKYSALNNGVTFKLSFGVRSRSLWRRLIDHNDFLLVAVVIIAISCTIFELFDIE